MVCARVIGNGAQITFAASMGQMQLNVYKPCIIAATLQSIQLLSDGCISFVDNCVQGMVVNEESTYNI